jgi:probable phosphoglycerate mutase
MRRLQGRSDIPLNEFGLELAQKTAEGLKDVVFDAAFSSPLIRARMTAQTVLEGRQIKIQTDERLLEIQFGVGEGIFFAEAKQDPNHTMYPFFNCPDRYVPDGGETFEQVRKRGWEFLKEVIFPLEGRCENVLVVAHGAFNRCLLNELAGVPDSDFWNFALPSCAVFILDITDGKIRIEEESKVYYGTPVNSRPC